MPQIGCQPLRRVPRAIHVRPERPPVIVELPFAHRHHHPPQPPVHALHIRRDAIQAQPPFREVDQVRRIVFAVPRQRCGRHDPARVAPQRFQHAHRRGQRAVVFPHIARGKGEEARRGRVARSMIGHAQVVVDGLGNPDRLQLVVRVARMPRNAQRRIHGAVAAGVEERAHLRAPQRVQQPRVVFIGERKPARSQRRAGRLADLPDRIRVHRQQIHQIAAQQPGQPVARSVKALTAPAAFFDETRHARIDHGRGSAAMCDHRFRHARHQSL